MNKITILICLFAITIFSACKKNDFTGTDTSIPAVPVTVSNLFGFYNGVPTVATSISGGGAVTISLVIPASSGRTIKEITRVGVASLPNDFTKIESVVPITGGSGTYTATPIAASGTSVTFSTTLAEYTAKTGLAVTTSGTATSFLGRYFMFLITLDNGDQLYSVGVRVYVNP